MVQVDEVENGPMDVIECITCLTIALIYVLPLLWESDENSMRTFFY